MVQCVAGWLVTTVLVSFAENFKIGASTEANRWYSHFNVRLVVRKYSF